MNRTKKIVSLLACSIAAVTLSACGPDYEKLDVTAVKASPLGGDVSRNHIGVPEGMIVKAHVVPYNDDSETMGCHVRAVDESVLEVTAIVNDRDYAFIGKKAGHTRIEFLADDKVVLIVEADVTAQPEQP